MADLRNDQVAHPYDYFFLQIRAANLQRTAPMVKRKGSWLRRILKGLA